MKERRGMKECQEPEEVEEIKERGGAEGVEIRDVSHSFGDKSVLCRVSLSVQKGEILGLLGPSGAGKTTLVSILTGQLRPDAGSVWIGGAPLWEERKETGGKESGSRITDRKGCGYRIADRKASGSRTAGRKGCGYRIAHRKASGSRITDRKECENGTAGSRAGRQGSAVPALPPVGVMMDNWGLYDRLSVYENLRFYAGLLRIDRDRIDEVLEKTDLTAARKIPVGNLSKGMRSRVNLCRALLTGAGFLFLDEPTSGLDPGTAQKIHRLILKCREEGATVFLTTHHMAEAQKICGRVALLHQGQIVEYGKPSEICRRYDHLKKIVVERKSGDTVSLANRKSEAESNAARLLGWMKNDDIAAIHSTEPDLERVFLELTGRRFT